MRSESENISFPGFIGFLGSHGHGRLGFQLPLHLFIDPQGVILDDVVNGSLDFFHVLLLRELIGSTGDTRQESAGVLPVVFVKPIPGFILGKGVIRVVGRCKHTRFHSLSLPFLLIEILGNNRR